MTELSRVAVTLARRLEHQDLLYLCDDDRQAEDLAAALSAMAPDHAVVFMPSSDALPGDGASASPGNIGQRMAALRRLRALQSAPSRARLACILSGEAAAQYHPAPDWPETNALCFNLGDTIDVAGLDEGLTGIGYLSDERVDEPGEFALRGEVADIFPADAPLPVRIEIDDGRITALRSYDPATQRTCDTLDTVEIASALEPVGGEGVTILDHMPSACVGLAPLADQRRRRFLALTRQGSDAWAATVPDREMLTVPPGDASPRFVEGSAPLAHCVAFLRDRLADGCHVLLAGSARDLRFLAPRLARRLKRELAQISGLAQLSALPPGSIAMLEAPVTTGFVDEDLVVIAAGDLLGSRALAQATSAASSPFTLSGEIAVGDVVVHEDHGVAVVTGLEPAPDAEMIALTYADKARRLVSVAEAGKIWRYGADADGVTLDKLNGSSWAKRRAGIEQALAESAAGLAALVTARAALTAPVIDPDPGVYEAFVSGFPFNETADQSRAIGQVRDDLARGIPMDRLIVGDVGYGKTEVALRAAALAALAGYQVVVAAPTTVLVRQHLELFRARFADTGVTVAGLSRLSSASEKAATKAGLADGTIAIVVGTGAVMGKAVTYRNLGLVIVDEEQRFGTADKARLRGDGTTHLLSLSATPIPRTLQMALVGLQQMSLIATPPARRQPIRTSVDVFDDGRVRAALLREHSRGGQSFVVVPRIEDMAGIAERLARIVPDLTVVQAHGKMPAAAIDEAMVGFAGGQGNILLATNIIEAGLDIPRANTMIVWRADRFGLAQLHQLRGRVGRSNRRGQVLLLTDGDAVIAEATLKRLRTLATLDRLGAGFAISARDLDMRGAGDLLGEDQAGHMKLIGTDLYQAMLGRALAHARGEADEGWSPEMHMGEAGSLPAAWIPEVDLRLTLYIRLARAEKEGAIEALEEELIDRFGPLPEAAETLLAQRRMALLARQAGIARIDAGPTGVALTPRPDFAGAAEKAGLRLKDGRWLLSEMGVSGEEVRTLLESLLPRSLKANDSQKRSFGEQAGVVPHSHGIISTGGFMTDTMDAIALLKADHRKVEELFEQFESATGSAKKRKIAEQICLELTVHTKIEEEIFYPACEGKIEEDLVNEAYVEHDGAKVLIAQIEAGSPDDKYYEAKVTVLSEQIQHHVKEEEQRLEGMFSQARKAGIDMDALGDQLRARKAELIKTYKAGGLPKPETTTFVPVDA